MPLRSPLAGFTLAAAAVFAADLVTKRLVESRFRLGEEVRIVDGPVSFRLAHVRNPGVAFGLFADLPSGWRIALFAGTVAVAGWVLWRIFADAGGLRAVRIALGLIAGGAAGNLLDRARYGEVVDFLDVWIGSFHWPTFNVADSGITVGTAILLFALWRAKQL
jgi:signal peptidase II